MPRPDSDRAGPAWSFGHAFERSLVYAVSAALFALMSITFVDVLGRYLFNSPLKGATELTELLLAVSIFLSLPLVTKHRDHITVDLFQTAIPAKLRPLRDGLVLIISSIVFGTITWLLWGKALQISAYGDYTQEYHIPMGPLVFLMVCMLFLSTVYLLTQLRDVHRGSAKEWVEPTQGG